MKKILSPLLSLFLLFALFSCGAPEPAPAGREGVLSSFSTVTIDGERVDQDIFRQKKLTVLNLWATYCPPCVQEMPFLARMHREMAEKGVQVVGVVLDGADGTYAPREQQLALARQIASSAGADYLQLLPSAEMAEVCSVQFVPTTLFLDENGCLVGEPYVGARSAEAWTALVEAALETLS